MISSLQRPSVPALDGGGDSADPPLSVHMGQGGGVGGKESRSQGHLAKQRQSQG